MRYADAVSIAIADPCPNSIASRNNLPISSFGKVSRRNGYQLGGLACFSVGYRRLAQVVLAIAGVVLLSVGIVVLHCQIERRIDQIGKV